MTTESVDLKQDQQAVEVLDLPINPWPCTVAISVISAA